MRNTISRRSLISTAATVPAAAALSALPAAVASPVSADPVENGTADLPLFELRDELWLLEGRIAVAMAELNAAEEVVCDWTTNNPNPTLPDEPEDVRIAMDEWIRSLVGNPFADNKWRTSPSRLWKDAAERELVPVLAARERQKTAVETSVHYRDLNAKWDALEQDRNDLIEEICDTPARSLAGLMCKAQIYARDNAIYEDIAHSIADDMLRVAVFVTH